jgi:hypothetical protein
VQIPLTFEEDLETNLDYTATKFTFKRFCTYKKRLLAVPREVTQKDSKESKVVFAAEKRSQKRGSKRQRTKRCERRLVKLLILKVVLLRAPYNVQRHLPTDSAHMFN